MVKFNIIKSIFAYINKIIKWRFRNAFWPLLLGNIVSWFYPVYGLHISRLIVYNLPRTPLPFSIGILELFVIMFGSVIPIWYLFIIGIKYGPSNFAWDNNQKFTLLSEKEYDASMDVSSENINIASRPVNTNTNPGNKIIRSFITRIADYLARVISKLRHVLIVFHILPILVLAVIFIYRIISNILGDGGQNMALFLVSITSLLCYFVFGILFPQAYIRKISNDCTRMLNN